jgi:hypothetical protein
VCRPDRGHHVSAVESIGHVLSGSAMEGLTLLLTHTLSITHLTLSQCPSFFRHCTLGPLVMFLKTKTCQLTSLRLDQSPLGKDAVRRLVASLTFNTTLATLSLVRCNLSKQSTVAVMRLLDQNVALRELDLSWNPVSAVALTSFAGNITLRRLCLSWCSITDDGAAALGNALGATPGTFSYASSFLGVQAPSWQILVTLVQSIAMDRA